MNVRTTRKGFLRGAGATVLTLPFLRLLERQAHGASPKRLVIMVTSCGTSMPEFWPGPDLQLGEILKPLEPLKRKLIVMRGINMNSAYKQPVLRDHQPDMANVLTGVQPTRGEPKSRIDGISIDQHLAKMIGVRTKFASLALGVRAGVGDAYLLATGPGQPIEPENNPQKVFDSLFSGLTGEPGGASMGTTAPDPRLARLRADRLSVIDVVKADLADVRCRLGAPERHKFDAHLQAVRELERNLTFEASTPTGPAAACRPPSRPGTVANASDQVPLLGKQQMDNIVAALACDLTRVAVLQWEKGGPGGITASWLGINRNQHEIAHNVKLWKSELVPTERWLAEQFGYLCGRLDAIPEGAGTLLDNTAVLWAHEQSDGNNHTRRDMPYVLAGSCGGFFRTGRGIQFPGTSHNNLLISLANALEVPITTFGDPAYATGPLSDLR